MMKSSDRSDHLPLVPRVNIARDFGELRVGLTPRASSLEDIETVVPTAVVARLGRATLAGKK